MKSGGKYVLYNAPDTDGRRMIYLRYYKYGSPIKRSAGIKVHPTQWDADKGRLLPGAPGFRKINKRLACALKLTDKAISESDSGNFFDIRNALENVFAAEIGKAGQMDFLVYCRNVADQRLSRGDLSDVRHDDHIRFLKYFSQYLLYSHKLRFVSVADFGPELIELYSAELAGLENKSDEMIYKMLAPVSAGAHQAMEDGLIDESLASELEAACMMERIDGKPDNVRKCLSITEVTALENYGDSIKDGPMKDAIDMFVFSVKEFAFSLHELMCLKWSDVDLDKGLIRRPGYRTSATSGALYPLSEEAGKILTRWLNRHETYVFGLIDANVNTQDIVFMNNIRASKSRRINKLLTDAATVVNIEGAISMQMARNTFAVNALRHGASLYVVSKALGHASTTVTAKMYADALRKSEWMEMEKIVRNL